MALTTIANANISRRGERGFTMVQMVVTVVIIAIVTTFAVVQITVARDHMRLTGAAHEFAGFTEKARLDSIRRHGSLGGGESKVIIKSTSGYTVWSDTDYNGTPTDKVFDFPEGVTIKDIKVTTSAGTVSKVPTAASPSRSRSTGTGARRTPTASSSPTRVGTRRSSGSRPRAKSHSTVRPSR